LSRPGCTGVGNRFPVADTLLRRGSACSCWRQAFTVRLVILRGRMGHEELYSYLVLPSASLRREPTDARFWIFRPSYAAELEAGDVQSRQRSADEY
jgi:hypothetical protein